MTNHAEPRNRGSTTANFLANITGLYRTRSAPAGTFGAGISIHSAISATGRVA